MARKDLLKSLIEQNQNEQGQGASKPITKPTPKSTQDRDTTPKINDALTRHSRGGVGAVSRSLKDLQNRSIAEIEPHLIAFDGVQDRIDDETEDDRMLLESLREYGQQVPILVRPNSEKPGEYLVVYGRRRLAALKALDKPVKALIREIGDDEAIVAQGQENTQRRNLSYIEKARFASEMEILGYDRKMICDTLAIDKTEISRMFKLLEALPENWILSIGSAPAVGRDRWIKLSEMIIALEPSEDHFVIWQDEPLSDKRFKIAFDTLKQNLDAMKPRSSQPKPDPDSLFGDDREPIGVIKRNARHISFEFYTRGNDGFEDWLIAEMPELHKRFKAKKS